MSVFKKSHADLHIFEESALGDLCREWQETLRLVDWTITILVGSTKSEDTGEEEIDGIVRWDMEHKMAEITVLSPELYPEDAWGEYDQEVILVHELLHLSLAPLDYLLKHKHHRYSVEQHINCVAKALVDLKRNSIKKGKGE